MVSKALIGQSRSRANEVKVGAPIRMAPRSKRQNGSTPVAPDRGEGIVALALIVLYRYRRKKRAIYPGENVGGDRSKNRKVTKAPAVPDVCFTKRLVLVDLFGVSWIPSGSSASESDTSTGRLQKTANGVGNGKQFARQVSE